MKKTFFSIALLFSLGFNYAQDILPDVQVGTLDGKTASIREFCKPGKIYVVDFWATWCSPCKKSLDNMMEVYPEWQEKYNVEIIAVTTDDARTFPKVAPMVASKEWPYTILSDKNEDLKRAINFQSVPFTFILDTEGKIVFQHSGYVDGDEFELEEKIKEIHAAQKK